MKDKTKRSLEIVALLAAGVIGAIAYSQTFSPEDQIFLTDHIFISPKTEPHFYFAFIFLNIGVFIFGVYLAFILIAFLLSRGLLFTSVGVFSLIMAATMLVVWFVIDSPGEEIADYIFSGIIILFLAVLGTVMIFGIPGRRNPRL